MNKKNLILDESLLGKVPDRMIAEKHGVSNSTVFRVRHKFNIRASHKHYEINGFRRKIDLFTLWSKLIPELGIVPDIELARQYGVSRERIRQIRNRRGIPKCPHKKKEAKKAA